MAMKDVEDFFPLSPMQQGMLFHTLYEPEAEAYFEQLSFAVRGGLDVDAFARAWQQVVDRHQALRSSFRWEGLKEPAQVIHRRAELEVTRHDWRDTPAPEREARLEELLREDRRRGFKLSLSPLMRLAVVRTGEDEHQVVWSHHHLLMDGWSVPIVLNEVAAFYAAHTQGRQVQLATPRPYRDYIAWLRRQDLKRARDFWRGHLRGFTTPTPLGDGEQPEDVPTDAPDFGESRASLPAEAASALQNFARRQHLTLSCLLNAMWALLLARYAGEDEVLFGVTVSGRPAELEGADAMVGLFINTLPMRVRLPAEGTPLSDWLKAVQSQQMEMLQYDYSPLVEIQGWGEVPRGLPLFESILVFENYPARPSSVGSSVTLEVGQVRTFQKSNYPLSVIVSAHQTISLQFVYDRHRFAASTISRLQEHFKLLLTEVVADPSRPALDLPALTEAERHLLLIDWNHTSSHFPRESAIDELFARQAALAPDSIALSFDGEQLTYGQLDLNANRLARHLLSRGVRPGTVVALLLPRSTQLIVSMMAALKAGAAYLPLDPTHPAERLRFMLEDSAAAALVADSTASAAELAKGGPPIIDLSREAALVASHPASAPPTRGLSSRRTAYVNYTSGSTGAPKGIAVPHRAVARLVLGTDFIDLTAADSVAQASNASFDALTFEVWGALLNGGRLVGVAQEVVLTPERYARQLVEERVTAMFMTTALFNQMARQAPWGFERVKSLLFGGQAADPGRAREVLGERGGGPGRLLHVYGPTENTTFSTWQLVEEVAPDARTVPIGRPVANSTGYVLDGSMRPTAGGAVGEFYVGGEGLAQGYVGRAWLTAERFVPNPFGAEAGARLYRTGDLVRMNAGGEVEFVGRVDDQVKIRGFRVEPEEVAAAVRAFEGVRACVVVAGEDAIGERQLVGYVVGDGRAGLGEELRRELRRRLPEYMVPARFVELDSLPLNANGKVDRKALPEPDEGVGDSLQPTQAPVTPVQQALHEIWTDVLKLERIGVADSFFDLGGHSLMATQIVSRINQVFQVGLSVRSLFETPTIAELAAVVDELRRGGRGEGEAPPLVAAPRDRELPLSFPQQRFWFMDRLLSASATHHVPAGITFDGRLSAAALAQSFSEIVRRHEVLRTNIMLGREQAVQVIRPHEHLGLPIVDLGGLDEAESEKVVKRLADEHLRRHFDLSGGPLLRLALLRSGAERNQLLFTCHHIVTDAWSIGLLVRELVTLYESYLKGAPSPLAELPIQYADFAVWQRGWLRGEVLEEQFAYWNAQLADVPPALEMTGRHAGTSARSASYANRPFFIPRALREGLAALGRREGVTTFMTLLAAYQVLLYRYTGRERVCVGSPVANRHRPETEGLIGCFINMLALCTDLGGNPSFREVLRRVREVTLGAYDHQDMPFDMLVGRLRPERALGQSPLIQTTISFQNTPSHELKLPGLRVSPMPIDAGAAEYELLVIVNGAADELGGVLVYNEEVFGAAEIDQMWEHLKMILEQAVARPECPILDLELGGGDPRRSADSPARAARGAAAEQFNF